MLYGSQNKAWPLPAPTPACARCRLGHRKILLQFADARGDVATLQAAKTFLLSQGLKNVQGSRILSHSVIISAGNTPRLSALLHTAPAMLIQELASAEVPLTERAIVKTKSSSICLHSSYVWGRNQRKALCWEVGAIWMGFRGRNTNTVCPDEALGAWSFVDPTSSVCATMPRASMLTEPWVLLSHLSTRW